MHCARPGSKLPDGSQEALTFDATPRLATASLHSARSGRCGREHGIPMRAPSTAGAIDHTVSHLLAGYNRVVPNLGTPRQYAPREADDSVRLELRRFLARNAAHHYESLKPRNVQNHRDFIVVVDLDLIELAVQRHRFLPTLLHGFCLVGAPLLVELLSRDAGRVQIVLVRGVLYPLALALRAIILVQERLVDGVRARRHHRAGPRFRVGASRQEFSRIAWINAARASFSPRVLFLKLIGSKLFDHLVAGRARGLQRIVVA